MKSRKAHLVIIFMLVGMYSSIALALPPMGSPKATLEKNKWALDFKYAYEEMDLKLNGKVHEWDSGLSTWLSDYTKYQIESLNSNIFLGSVDYGISDNWDVYAQFGLANAQDEITETLVSGATGNQYCGFSGDYGFAWGFGTRATLCQNEHLTWGGLFQMTWLNPGDSGVKLRGDPTFSGDVELDFWEIQVAFGPTLKQDSFAIYGGPFLHFVRGKWELKGVTDLVTSSADIREESILGGYGGVQWDINENTHWYSEYQLTADAWGIGTGFVWKIP
jgi:hypothetical protein